MIDDLWYKNTVVYSLDVETFMDGDGDGVGDFAGLTGKLDHLQSLGVGTLWLAPIQPTPDRDDGYDVTDYYGVDPRLGSSGDFVEFMHHASERGMRVVLDLVVNHTSDKHRWFQQARRDPNSRYRDWYVWSKKRPKDWNKGMVFPGVQKATWTRDEQAGEYYHHRFYEFQPDLNLENPEVRDEIRRVMGYWLQLGVAGFRLDAVPFVLEARIPGQGEGEQRFEHLAEMREFLQWRAGKAILLGEANVLPAESRRFFDAGGPGGLHMMFNFFVNQHLFLSLATGEVEPLAEALKATRNIPAKAQWGQFLRNHDELDLGRLTDEQRERVFARFAPDEEMRLYGRGVRRRLAPMLGNRSHLELATSLTFALPGTPVIRYGDEIGMGEDLSLPERHAVRTPMQWSAERHAGFTTAEKPVEPAVSEGVYSYERVNVESQRRDPRSLLNWTRTMIRLRNECPEIGRGDWKILKAGSPHVLALRYDWRGGTVVTLHNFDEHACEAKVRVAAGDRPDDDHRLVDLIDEGESRPDARGTHRVPLDAYGYRWFRADGPCRDAT